MKTKNYMLIVIIILAFALISINLGDLTGSTTKDSIATIKVTPSSIKSGEKITIEVVPGNKGVRNEVKIYKECNSNLITNCESSRLAIIHLCSSTSYAKNCRDPYTKTYKTSSNLKSGLYYAKITEYAKADERNYREQKAYFRIEEEENPYFKF